MRSFLALGLVIPLLASLDAQYRVALPGYRYSFPRDHFEHQEFRTEWWYYTGNVWSADGHRFGFELVFFRDGDRLGARGNPSVWRVDDLYLANAALTDVDGKRFKWVERLNRAGPGIAGASFAQQRIWNGNWSDTWNGERQTLKAVTEEFSFHLDCAPEKPFVIEGENGVSRKSEGLGHASYYVSFPRLSARGTILVSGREYQVSGQAWMDHEWFTGELGAGQVGWDWFSVQLDNKTELMIYDFRRKDGAADPFSSATYIAADGSARHLTAKDFSLQPGERWHGYPVAWSIRVPSLHLELECRAKVRDQELRDTHGGTYWEGAVDYTGSQRGVGYLEMTGYDKAFRLP